ncbi:MAG TPA: Rrf2 family transcriptional regulator [Blastocatellia bacterium]|nr:Rrf2 family transcriptional regulator [Blastocatellia bacterium]
MKLSAQEEYGLRCLLRLGAQRGGGSLTIPEISRAEGISAEYVAKIMRILRQGGLVTSARGAAGGYTLARTPEQITAGEALAVLGGRLFESDFCDRHAGAESLCTHSIDCSIRSLWRALQNAVDNVLTTTTLRDLLCSEPELVLLMSDRTRTQSPAQLRE